jgi:hypothetical protein
MKALKRLALALTSITVIFALSQAPQAHHLGEKVKTSKEMAAYLERSVGALQENNQTICTATKVGPRLYLTASHCVFKGADYRIEFQDFEYHYVRYITVPVESKWERDWALLTTSTENPDRPSLEIECSTTTVYKGQDVAYVGHAGVNTYAYREGYVSTLDKPTNFGPFVQFGQDFAVAVPAAPGSSGSAIVSFDTGKIIGILTELNEGSRGGGTVAGVETVKTLALCASEDNGSPPEIFYDSQTNLKDAHT